MKRSMQPTKLLDVKIALLGVIKMRVVKHHALNVKQGCTRTKCNKFNAQLRESLNREALQKREETTRDNKITLQLAKEKYECHYKKDMGHNEKIELMLQQTAEIREQLVCAFL